MIRVFIYLYMETLRLHENRYNADYEYLLADKFTFYTYTSGP